MQPRFEQGFVDAGGDPQFLRAGSQNLTPDSVPQQSQANGPDQGVLARRLAHQARAADVADPGAPSARAEVVDVLLNFSDRAQQVELPQRPAAILFSTHPEAALSRQVRLLPYQGLVVRIS